MVEADDIAGVAEAVREEEETKSEEGEEEADGRAGLTSEDKDDEDDGEELDNVAAVEGVGSGTRRTPITTTDKNAGSRGG
jgi:hypothetical protein